MPTIPPGTNFDYGKRKAAEEQLAAQPGPQQPAAVNPAAMQQQPVPQTPAQPSAIQALQAFTADQQLQDRPPEVPNMSFMSPEQQRSLTRMQKLMSLAKYSKSPILRRRAIQMLRGYLEASGNL